MLNVSTEFTRFQAVCMVSTLQRGCAAMHSRTVVACKWLEILVLNRLH